MKKIYSFSKKLFVLILFLIQFKFAKSQFTTAGDIAFTGYIGGGTNEFFSFVILKNIPAGSTLNFTDRGWNGTAFNTTTESLLTWTAGSALVAGREITISGAANSTTMTAVVSGSSINAGTVTGTMVSLPTSGDQILAYVGTVAAPTFIAGIHMNSYNNGNGGTECGSTSAAGWDPAACANPGNVNSSALPAGLTGGTTAVYIGVDNTFNSDFDNAVYNCTGALATPAQVRASVNNYTAGVNWTTENGATPTFSLPSGCAFLASIFPMSILSFNGSNNASSILLEWQTTNESNDNGFYELEKSVDGITFYPLTSIQRLGFSYLPNNYSYKDNNPVKGANFYRLKMKEDNGAVKYSNIVKVLFGKNGKSLQLTPNPANAEVTVSSSTNLYNNITITDNMGRVVLTEKLITNNQKVDVSQLPIGQYTITLVGTKDKVSDKLLIVR